MVGNDVIDLKLAAKQSNWKRPRFLDKLFTKKEQQLILESSNSFETVWLFWSMKESAYKIYMQLEGSRFFAPQKFECFMLSLTQGFVTFDKCVYKTHSTITSSLIHTVCTSSKATVTSAIIPLEYSSRKTQSETIYEVLKCNIAKKGNLKFKELEIRKTETGIPKLYYKSTLMDVSFSLSHHGKYGALAFL